MTDGDETSPDARPPLRRGDVVRVRQKGVFTGKPRPAVVVQNSDLLDDAGAVVVCLVTNERVDDPPFYRIGVRPTSRNGLQKRSQIMADLPVPILKANVTAPIGRLSEKTLGKLNAALALFLDLG